MPAGQADAPGRQDHPSTTTEPSIPSVDRFQILALDGGGAKALFTAHVLARLEQDLDVSIKDSFDLIAGTSAGGIVALALGAAAVRVLPRMMRTAGVAPVALSALLVLLVGWTAPALTGGLYISELDVPDYWHEAAEAVDAGDPAARVLLLPGQTRSSYRWSQERPDDLPNSLLARDAVIPETTPNTSPWGGNYLAALDDTLQSGSASDSEISTYARYLGADQVLLRHDIAWEPAGGARPAITAAALADDPGLVAIRNFGRPGQNTQSPSSPPTSSEELLLPPVQLYGVSRPQRVVRAQSAAGSVVVSGDGWALAPMARAGMLEDSPAFRYAADLTSDQLAASLGPRSRMVLTDTNQRRAAITNRLTANEGAALAEDEELAGAICAVVAVAAGAVG